jgi:predicted CxxxxCH...CXXCH cytochrome family protein
MRPDLRLATAVLAALALAACADPQPAAPSDGGGGGGPATGAHQAHLTDGPFAGPFACTTCHDSAFAVVFPPPSLARSNGASPSFDATAKTCSNVYCHAGAPQLPLPGGTLATPIFNPPSTVACGACHGVPPPAPHAQSTNCGGCHDGYTSTAVNKALHLNGVLNVSSATCTACHGDGSRTATTQNPQLPAAPPKDTGGNTATTFPGVGAHQAHLNDGTLRKAMACTECHTVPGDTAHATQPLQLTWGPLATADGASPTFSATSYTCSATYCHGSTLNAGGTLTNPVWISGASQVACGSCHAVPPPAPHSQNASCGSCHAGYTATTVNLDTHVNGIVDVSAGACSACHGDANRAPTVANPLLPAAPPVAPAGKPAAVVGTHQLHLNDNPIRQAVACASCHVVPADGAHAAGVAQPVQFSGLATSNGAAPTYAATTLTCSATYCHGNFSFAGITGNAGATPAWDATPTSACTNCHGLPPTGHPAVPGTTAASCNGCHPQTVNANGTINVTGGLHINGAANEGAHAAGWADRTQHGYAASAGGLAACTTCHVGYGPAAGVAASSCNTCHGGTAWQSSCTFCHGTPGRTGNLTGTDALLPAAPPVGTQGESATTQAAVGAHQAHANPTASAALAAPIACAVCHPSPLPTDVTHVNGQPAAVQFSGVAVTGGITTAAYASGSCSATYCHGNFTGGARAAPSWTGAPLACTACHATAPQTGQHARHMSLTGTRTLNCLNCHNGIATGTGNPSTNAALVGSALHVNGTKNVVFGGTFLGAPVTGTWTGTNCTVFCHGSETW